MKNNLIFGIHACKQFLASQPGSVEEVLLQKGSVENRLNDEIDLGAFRVQLVEKQKLDGLTEGGNHQGIALRVQRKNINGEKQLDGFISSLLEQNTSPLILVLDNITDPHNLGACLRTAAAANASAVLLPKDKSAGINATVSKVAAGAAESLDIFVVTNLARSLDRLKQAGIWLVGTELNEEARSLYDCDLKGPLAIVMGSEGGGMRRLTREKCDFLCYLPMPGEMQSLNVSVATGVCLFEALRQRG